MKITITITELISNKSFDIQVDSKQRIKTTLRVLSENMPEMELLGNVSRVRIKGSGRQIAGEVTYEEAGIYTGMELVTTIEKEG